MMDVTQTHIGNDKSTLNHSSIKRLMHFIHNLEAKLLSVKTIHEKLQELMSVVSTTHDNIVEELTTIKSVLNESTIEQKQVDEEVIPIDTTNFELDEDDQEQQEHNEEDDGNNDNHKVVDNNIDQNRKSSVRAQASESASTKEFESKSVTNLNSKDPQVTSASTRRTDRLSLFSASSFASSSSTSSTLENRPSSSVSKRSSNLKKLDQQSVRARSPKSVTFNFDAQKRSNAITDENITPTSPLLSHVGPVETPLSEIENHFIPTSMPMMSNLNETLQMSSDFMPDLFKQYQNEVTTQPNIGYKVGNALTIVRIHEIEPVNGEYLRLLNASNSDDYDLSGHYLQQNISCMPVCRFRFPPNTIIRSGQTITIWCGTFKDIEPQFPHVFVWKEKRRWETGPECVTILAKPNHQAIAWARSSYRLNADQSSSDILFVHSKSSIGISDSASITSNTFKNRSRLSAYNFVGSSNKPPFAQSPDSPVHPNNSGRTPNQPNESRPIIYQRQGGCSPLLNRPKSSPFASHTGCKQDLISMKFLRKQQIPQANKQTSVKT